MNHDDGKPGYQASSASYSEAGPPTLLAIPLDLQIIICTLLQPSDILALRQTCKILQLPTRQRIVWVAALHRVCIDNYLFLPSFPVLDMSDVELEQAAMGPRRWIELCTAFGRRHPGDSGATLRPRTTRIIEASLAAANNPELFIVPGGRYIVGCSPMGTFVWDFGYTSNADCRLIASVGPEDGPEDGYCACVVQVTPDGMGLTIFCYANDASIYEIYLQSETPQLTCIAHLDLHSAGNIWASLFPDRVIWYRSNGDSILFTVWDYRKNYSTSFSANVDFAKLEYFFKIIATKTEIFLLCLDEILVWAIPPLLSRPPDFSDHNPIHIPPLFGITYPGIVRHTGLVASQTMPHWYYGSSQPLYFSILCRDAKLHRFEIIVKPDLFDTSFRIINTEVPPDDFPHAPFDEPRICEDTLVAYWESDDPKQFRVYTGLTSSGFTTVNSYGGPAAKMLLSGSGYKISLCPASGRYVYLDSDICGIVVVDLF